MKKFTIIIIMLMTYSLNSIAQDEKYNILLLGDIAPSFTAKSTNGDINFPADYFGKWKIIFSHPADFTPVCSSELLELASLQDQFKKLNTELIVLSTDGINSHIQWVMSLEDINYKDKGKLEIKFPIISDDKLDISKQYGMIHPNTNKFKTIRSVFIIDPDNKVQTILCYPMNIGRNIDEILRILIALQEVYEKPLLTPANWQLGDDLLITSPETIEESKKLEAKKDDSLYNLVWYMWFKKNKKN